MFNHSPPPFTSCLHLSASCTATKPFATERYFLIPSVFLARLSISLCVSPLLLPRGQTRAGLKPRFQGVGCSSGAFSLRSNLGPGSSTWPVPPRRQFNHTNSTPFPFPPLLFTHFIIPRPTLSLRSVVFWGLKNDIISDLDKCLFSYQL